MEEIKKWVVAFDHNDGRNGTIEVITEVKTSKAYQYGNAKVGKITVGKVTDVYDLRYAKGDLHMIMIEGFFGKGLVKATEQ